MALKKSWILIIVFCIIATFIVVDKRARNNHDGSRGMAKSSSVVPALNQAASDGHPPAKTKHNPVPQTFSKWESEFQKIGGTSEEKISSQIQRINEYLSTIDVAQIPEFVAFVQAECGDIVFGNVIGNCVGKMAFRPDLLKNWITDTSSASSNRQIIMAQGSGLRFLGDESAISEVLALADPLKRNYLLRGGVNDLVVAHGLDFGLALLGKWAIPTTDSAWMGALETALDQGDAKQILDRILTGKEDWNMDPRFLAAATNSLARKDIESAVRVAGSLIQQGSEKGVLVSRNVAEQWVRTSPRLLSQWAVSLPSGPAKDAVAETLATHLYHSSPADALEWSNSISDEALRDTTNNLILTYWNKTSPAEVANWRTSQSK